MHAIQIREYGPPEALHLVELPDPTPGPGDVLIRVGAAGVNPVDAKLRRGASLPHLMLPVIPGWDVCGTVVALGEGVERFAVGDAVYGMVRFPKEGRTYAEMVAAPAAHLTPKPESLTHAEAAALPLVALTAWQALIEFAGLQAGHRVLIHAGAGGVGHVAIQMAAHHGAEVITTASAGNHAFVRKLGASRAVDYRTEAVGEVINGCDVVLDAVGGEVFMQSLPSVKPGGVIVALTGYTDEKRTAAEQHGIRSGRVLVRPELAHLEAITALVAGGHLRPHIQQTFPLSQATDAHRTIEGGHVRGKLVLIP